MQTEKGVKEPNSAPVRGVLCAQGTHRETQLKAHQHWFCLFLLLYRHMHTKWCKISILESILEKTVGYVLSESKQFSKKVDMHHYIGYMVS